MLSTYKLNADELSSTLIQVIKKAYQHQQIEITIQTVEDETDYLMESAANREHLLKSIAELDTTQNRITTTLEALPQ